MDFQLTPLQEELRETTRKLCAGRFAIASSRAANGRVERQRDANAALAFSFQEVPRQLEAV